MKGNEKYLPEGMFNRTKQNFSLTALTKAQAEGTILEANAILCDSHHNLLVDLNGMTGIIPREECALGIENGKTREIAIISRVGKPVCFKVLSVDSGKIMLSRREAQKEALAYFLKNYTVGDIVPARVTHLEPFGAFVDIGCGVVSLIGIENISVSRIFHPSERFTEGQNILAAILNIDYINERITLTHRELLGTWEQNAALFKAGETVRGIVRGIEDYGIFIELSPNLSGLAERREQLKEGQAISVYIKSILPERMKIKLTIIESIGTMASPPPPFRYFLPRDESNQEKNHIDKWVYTPESCKSKHIETIFE